MVARPAQLVLYVSREGSERTMETLLIIVVLLFLFEAAAITGTAGAGKDEGGPRVRTPLQKGTPP
jgi:hypothetical protein